MPVSPASDDDLTPGGVDVARFREVLGRFASGVTVVTGIGPWGPVGLTVQGFMSVSLDPPLVLVSASRSSRAWPVIERSGAYCVNLLAADQSGLSDVMATRAADKFQGVDWHPAPGTGSPVLAGGLGHVDCRIERIDDGGDHLLALGRVVALGHTEPAGPDGPDGTADPLIRFRGRYGTTR